MNTSYVVLLPKPSEDAPNLCKTGVQIYQSTRLSLLRIYCSLPGDYRAFVLVTILGFPTYLHQILLSSFYYGAETGRYPRKISPSLIRGLLTWMVLRMAISGTSATIWTL